MKKYLAFLLIPIMTVNKLFLIAFDFLSRPCLSCRNLEGVQRADMAAAIAFACRSLQTTLLATFGKNIPALRTMGDFSYLKWLLSPQNTAGFRKISNDIEGVPGKKRGVAFRVETPFCFNVCAVNTTCETVYETVTSLDQEIVFDLNQAPFRHCDAEGNPQKLRFTESELERFCTETDTSYIQNKIAMYLLRFEEALDAAMTTLLTTQIGNNGQNQALTELPFFTAANTFTPNMAALNPEAMWALDQVYKDMGMSGQYAIIGGAIISKMASYLKWATFNSAGLDLSKADPLSPYPAYNRNFATTFTDRDFILFSPGAQQLVTWNKYKGEKQRTVTNLYSKGTVVLPRTGIEVDWKWWYDYDCEVWTFEAFLHAELATVPAGGCTAGVANTNGIIRVHDCGTQPIIPTCPEVIEA